VTTGGFLENGNPGASFKAGRPQNVAVTIPWLFAGRWYATTSE
jgi:hypothetical protein